jgi:hypothetical protein
MINTIHIVGASGAETWSNLKEPLVYLTSSKQLAAHYIWPTEKFLPTLKFCRQRRHN